MTLPKANDERIVNLFNRANHQRQQNEFDKALSTYEIILNEDNTNAEAHWCIVLCRYGIEYVEDPKTRERIPTCHRVQYESILSDADYIAAVENASDAYTKTLYEEEAKKISEIQKGILVISNQEEPYDVFICYKETADSGTRTVDSTIAQDIYYHLTNDGYRVFFSKITLEDKLGKQYEPYIFSALNSAKVMLVIGTKREYFNAVWVKNEWSRFLSLMKKDRTRLLIPCYRDMDAYDIPDELANLQSQDMSKVGFIQDILRGVKKVLGVSKPTESAASTTTTAAISAVAGTESLTKRGFLFLENSNWEKASEYFDKALDINPEYAQAYIGMLCCELKITNENELSNQKRSLSDKENYKMAIRFADVDYRTKIEGYEQTIDKCLKQEEYNRQEEQYKKLIQKKREATSDFEFNEIAAQFKKLNGFKDSKSLANECEMLSKKARYAYFIELKNKATTEKEFRDVAYMFGCMNGYKDTKKLMEECENAAEEKRQKGENERKERERIAEANRIAQHECMISEKNERLYQELLHVKENANDLQASRQSYINLSNRFQEMNGYKDTKILAEECMLLADETETRDKYIRLIDEKKTNINLGNFKYLENEFRKLSGYKDSDLLANECKEKYLQLVQRQREEQEEKNRKEEEQRRQWVGLGLCYYCGGKMGGVFTKKCKSCDKAK
jgi:hypothetical protein